MKIFILTSNPMCSAPGLARFFQNGAKFPKDRYTMARALAMGFPHLPWLAVEKILDGDCVIDDKAETVTVKVELIEDAREVHGYDLAGFSEIFLSKIDDETVCRACFADCAAADGLDEEILRFESDAIQAWVDQWLAQRDTEGR